MRNLIFIILFPREKREDWNSEKYLRCNISWPQEIQSNQEKLNLNGEGIDYPLHYSCLEIHGRGVWQATFTMSQKKVRHD